LRQKNKARLTEGSIIPQLIKLTLPMIIGIVGIVGFNLADTYFIGQLGKDQLAALGFTFPIVLVISSIALGLGTGAGAVISRAIGRGDHHEVQKLTNDSLILSISIVAIMVVIGLLTIEEVFKLVGAGKDTLPYIKEYMSIWYPGMIFVVVPMVGNNAIRATGDTLSPSIIMVVAVIMNITLDPMLIWGIGPFPELGIKGAALSTVISRATTFTLSLLILAFQKKMIDFKLLNIKNMLLHWKQVIYIAIPAAATRIIIPIGTGIITRMVSEYSKEAVAGFGVSAKIDRFALTFVLALSTVIAPYVGQNWGADKKERVILGLKYSKIFSLIYGAVIMVLFWVLAYPIASIFNDDPKVVEVIVLYLRTVPVAYAFHGILLLATQSLNVLNRPFLASFMSIIQMFIIFVPLSFLGSYLFGIRGIFGAFALSYILGGIISHLVLNRIIHENRAKGI
jgi:putative MATE family efflux protein